MLMSYKTPCATFTPRVVTVSVLTAGGESTKGGFSLQDVYAKLKTRGRPRDNSRKKISISDTQLLRPL